MKEHKLTQKQLDMWLESIDERLDIMACEAEPNEELRRLLAGQMLSVVCTLMKKESTLH